MNMSKTMRCGKRGRRTDRKKRELLLRYSFTRQALEPYPHLFFLCFVISSISSAKMWACSSVSRRSKTFANSVESDQPTVHRLLLFLQTAITFDPFGVTGSTTYQNEALSKFYVSNDWNCHGSVSCAEKFHLKFFLQLGFFRGWINSVEFVVQIIRLIRRKPRRRTRGMRRNKDQKRLR